MKKRDRTLEIETLMEVIEKRERYKENSEHGLVILLNGAWGSGKSTFLKDFQEKIETSENIKLFDYYNSFEFDFYENAYIPFFSRISNTLSLNYEIEKLLQITDKNVKKMFISVLKEVFKSITKLDPDQIFQNIKEFTNADKEYLTEFNEFVNLKEQIKNKVREICKEKPHVFIIDELDRCNPKFALETLEIIKHFFDIENCIFVVAVDKIQLKEAAKTIFGQNRNAEIYFSKFFDYQFNLNILSFNDTLTEDEINENKELILSASKLFKILDISLRDSNKIVNDFLMKKEKFEKETQNKWTLSQSFCMLFLFVLKYTDLTFLNAILNQEYDIYKERMKNADSENAKYRQALNMKVNGENILTPFLSNITFFLQEKYIDKIHKDTVRLSDNLFNHQVKVLRELMEYVPQIEIDKTYFENIKRIIN